MKTIALVLRSGKDFTFNDVVLIVHYIWEYWEEDDPPKILCFWDKASIEYDLGNMKIIPLHTSLKGTWARMLLYSPEMEKYKPFLYLDLDTIVLGDLSKLIQFIQVTDKENRFITLEDFYQKGQLATGVVWFPKNCDKTKKVWDFWCKKGKVSGNRMDYFLRKITKADLFWQQLTEKIITFKPKNKILKEFPKDKLLVCLHGKPRIFNADVQWVKEYIKRCFNYKVTVIIPYKEDRGWLNEAINSVPKDVQLIVSQGEGNWPENFNKVLSQVKGEYVKFLHEDDMLFPDSIEKAVEGIEKQNVDFVHGNAIEIFMSGRQGKYVPSIKIPTIEDLKKKNVIHSVTLMYKKEIFDKIGGFDESLNTQEEYEFNLRCLKAGFKIGYCNSELGIYRRHAKQKVRMVSKEEKVKEKQLVNEKYA